MPITTRKRILDERELSPPPTPKTTKLDDGGLETHRTKAGSSQVVIFLKMSWRILLIHYLEGVPVALTANVS